MATSPCIGSSCVSVSRYPKREQTADPGTGGVVASLQAPGPAARTARAARPPEPETFDLVISPSGEFKGIPFNRINLVFRLAPKGAAIRELERSLVATLKRIERLRDKPDYIDLSIAVPDALLRPVLPNPPKPRRAPRRNGSDATAK